MPLRLLLVVAVLLLARAAVAAPVVLELAHDLDADRQSWLLRVVERFNASQAAVVVRPVPAAALRPALALLDAGAAVGGDRRFRPLYRVMREAGGGFDASTLTPETVAVVADAQGRPRALPIAQSTPLLFYDKAAFRRAGLDPEAPPKTWDDVRRLADRLFDAGSTCPFTASQPSLVLVEQHSLWHGEPVFVPRRPPALNGLVQVRHIALMASWVRSRFFVVFGHDNEADRHFAAGECGMIATGSDLFPVFRRAGIEVGVTRLPVHDAYPGVPRFTAPTGRALWVGEGLSRAEYRAAARFVRFLMDPGSQAELARDDGFLPFAASGQRTLAAAAAAAPQQSIALAQIRGSRGGALVSAAPRLRAVLDEELDAVWSDRKPAKAALDSAAARIGELLRAPGAAT